jgi:hypothetical protein
MPPRLAEATGVLLKLGIAVPQKRDFYERERGQTGAITKSVGSLFHDGSGSASRSSCRWAARPAWSKSLKPVQELTPNTNASQYLSLMPVLRLRSRRLLCYRDGR